MTDFVDARDFAETMMRFIELKKREKKTTTKKETIKKERVKKEKPKKEKVKKETFRKPRSKIYDYDDIKAMRENGAYMKDIAEKYGVSLKKMRGYLYKHNIYLPDEYQKEHNKSHGGCRKWDRQEFLRMYQSGMTIAQLAEHFGCTEKAVSNVLVRARKELKEMEAKKCQQEQQESMTETN